MVRAGQFEMSVLVGGAPLRELVLPKTGEVYVESQFRTAVSYSVSVEECDPYGEKFTQQWPVTPYTLRIVNNSGDKAEAQVFVDGALACKQFVDAGVNEIKGFRNGDWNPDAPCQEFTFTLPRRVRSHENPEPDFSSEEKAALKQQLESIRVEIREAKFQRTEQRMCDGIAADASMEQVNKSLAKAAGAACASASGKAVAGVVRRGEQTFHVYDIGTKVVAEMVIRYSQRRKLENLGLLEPEAAAGHEGGYAVPRSRKTAAGGAGGASGSAAAAGDDVKFGAAAKKMRTTEDADGCIDLS